MSARERIALVLYNQRYAQAKEAGVRLTTDECIVMIEHCWIDAGAFQAELIERAFGQDEVRP